MSDEAAEIIDRLERLRASCPHIIPAYRDDIPRNLTVFCCGRCGKTHSWITKELATAAPEAVAEWERGNAEILHRLILAARPAVTQPTQEGGEMNVNPVSAPQAAEVPGSDSISGDA